jgi:hypothetical protein
MVYSTGRAAVDSWRRGGWCALVGIDFINPNKCLAIALAVCLKKEKKKKRRWMKEWLKKRSEYTHENLLRDPRLSEPSDLQNLNSI